MKERKNSIELLKLFAIITIIIGHLLDHFSMRENLMNYLNFKLEYSAKISLRTDFIFIISGFFLYYNINKASIAITIQKLYLRLIPDLLILFICLFLLGLTKLDNIFGIISLTCGLSIPGQIIPFGAWSIGVYFWSSVLYIFILHDKKYNNMLYVLIICYIGLCLMINTKPITPFDNISGTYNSVIGTGLTRGIVAIGFGILAAVLNNNLNFVKTQTSIIIFTILEIFLLCKLIFWLIFKPTNILFLLIAASCLIISFYNSCGIISIFLNKKSKINIVSRYAYSMLIMHALPILYFKSIITDPLKFFLLSFCVTVFLGVIVHHLARKITHKLNIFKS